MHGFVADKRRLRFCYPDRRREELIGLPKDECRQALLSWAFSVRLKRPGCPAEEHLRCPMLWCRQKFADPEVTADHASNCDLLDNGWYYCVQCGRPERLWVMNKTEYVLRRTKSSIMKATTFVRSHSRGPSASESIVSSPEVGTGDWSGTSPCPQRWPCEMESPERYAELGDDDLSEMMSPPPYNHADQHAKGCHHPPERSYQHFVAPSWVDEKAGRPAPLAPLDIEVFHELASRLSHALQHEMADQTIDPTLGVSAFRAELAGDSSLLDSLYVPPEPKSPVGSEEVVIDEGECASADSLLEHDDTSFEMSMDNFGFLETDPSRQRFNQEIRKTVCSVASAWKEILTSEPDLYFTYSQIDHSALFDMGVHSLEGYGQGILPTTFNDIFALMHLSYAMSCLLDFSDGLYCRDGWFKDASKWQFVLSEVPDQRLFGEILQRLYCAQNASATLSSTIGMYAHFEYELLPATDQALSRLRLMEECMMFWQGRADGKSLLKTSLLILIQAVTTQAFVQEIDSRPLLLHGRSTIPPPLLTLSSNI